MLTTRQPPWKLGQVLAGADDRLLDSYQAERQPIAAGVLGLSTEKYAGFATMDPSSLRRGTDEQQLELTYHGGPLAPADTGRTTALRVGDRAPDAPLLGVGGARVRLFDLYRGPHFTLIAHGAQAADALNRLALPRPAPRCGASPSAPTAPRSTAPRQTAPSRCSSTPS